MSIAPGPYNIGAHVCVLGPDGGAHVKAVGEGLYEELDAEFDGFKGHCLVQRYAFKEDWPGWEMHPCGDEVVYLLSGDADFALWRDGREEVLRLNRAGDYVCVPKGVWHTARARAETAMLFITPGEGTLHAAEPGG